MPYTNGRFLVNLVILVLCIQVVHAGYISVHLSGESLPFGDTGSLGIPENQSVNESVKAELFNLPLTFIPNVGQADSAVLFMVKGSETSFSFTRDTLLFSMQKSTDDLNESSFVITQAFIGSNDSVRMEGLDLLPGTANFFIGPDQKNWQANLSTFGSVRYHDLYPGIDLLYRGNGSVLKREFIVSPGISPSLIRMKYSGMDSLALDPSGALNITAGSASMTESKPVCYQDMNGSRRETGARYVLSGENELRIEPDIYDPAYPLIIDPDLVYSTYLGGGTHDYGYGIAVDSGGNTYVTGKTYGVFPTTPGANQTVCGGGMMHLLPN